MMNLKNELYYNPATYNNENYDRTAHQGIEMDFKSKLPCNFKLSGSYTFDQAVFKRGVYKDKSIPMVPEHKFNLDLSYFFTDNFSWGFSSNYLSSSYFINDESNNFPRIKQALTIESKLAGERNLYEWDCLI